MRKLPFIVAALAMSAIGFSLYFTYRVPSGLEPKGESSETVALISLAIAVVSLLTSLVGLVQKVIELRATQDAKK